MDGRRDGIEGRGWQKIRVEDRGCEKDRGCGENGMEDGAGFEDRGLRMAGGTALRIEDDGRKNGRHFGKRQHECRVVRMRTGHHGRHWQECVEEYNTVSTRER